jgi:hypothetical protein
MKSKTPESKSPGEMSSGTFSGVRSRVSRYQ